MTLEVRCFLGIDDCWEDPGVQLWHPTGGTLARVPLPQFSLKALSTADEEAQRYRQGFGFDYGNYDVEYIYRTSNPDDERAWDQYIDLLDARRALMQSWVHMYDPGPPDGFGTCALEDQLEKQLLAETNKRLERDPDLSHAVSQRGPWRALWVDGVNLAADPEYSPDGVFSYPAQLHISDRVYASSC